MTDGLRQIIQPILQKFEVSEEEVLSTTRKRHIAYCRFACMKAVRENTFLSLLEIGRQFNRDHSTVMHGISEAEYLETDPTYKRMFT